MVDRAPFAVGSISDTLEKYPHLRRVLTAMGYSGTQREALKKTIESSDAEVVLNASPAGVGALLGLTLPVVRVQYQFKPLQGVDILARVRQVI